MCMLVVIILFYVTIVYACGHYCDYACGHYCDLFYLGKFRVCFLFVEFLFMFNFVLVGTVLLG